MGNCVTSSTSNKIIKWRFIRSDKLLRIIKVDGKVMEYSKPVLVEELLSSFHGFGVSISNNSSLLLPPDHELRTGKSYHLLPLGRPQFSGSPDLKPPAILSEVKEEGGRRRVKVLLTKKQLQELLSMDVSLEELAIAACSDEVFCEGNGGSWKPELDTILEEDG